MRTLKIKKPFVLLEVLIALALVSATILPFLRYPYKQMQHQIQLLFNMELERYAQNELCHWLEAIYQKDDLIEKRIFKEEKSYAQYDIGNQHMEIELFKGCKKKFIRKLYINWTRQKKSDEGHLFAFVNIKLEYYEPKTQHALLTATTQGIARKKI